MKSMTFLLCLGVFACGKNPYKVIVLEEGKDGGTPQAAAVPAEPDDPEKWEYDGNDPAGRLNLNIVGPNVKDQKIPDPRATVLSAHTPDKVKDEGSLVDDREIIFKKSLNLQLDKESDGVPIKPLFLVWHQDALESRITDAFFAHRRLNQENQIQGESIRSPARFSEKTGFWFLPLSEVLWKTIRTGSDSTDFHWLTLDLHLRDGNRVLVSVGFRVQAPTPFLSGKNLNPYTFHLSSQDFFKQLRRGFVLSKRRFENTTKRKMILWVRGSGNLVFRATFKAPVFSGGEFSPPVLTGAQRLYTESKVQISRLSVKKWEKPNIQEKFFKISKKKWLSLELNPEETVDVSWIADFMKDKNCRRPENRRLAWGWKEKKKVRKNASSGPRRGEPTYYYETVLIPRATYVDEVWSWEGAELKGHVDIDARFSRPHVQKEQVLGPHSQLGKTVMIGKSRWSTSPFFCAHCNRREMKWSFGTKPSLNGKKHCQGVLTE